MRLDCDRLLSKEDIFLEEFDLIGKELPEEEEEVEEPPLFLEAARAGKEFSPPPPEPRPEEDAKGVFFEDEGEFQ